MNTFDFDPIPCTLICGPGLDFSTKIMVLYVVTQMTIIKK